ncbi:MAG: hypothetical protein WA817_12135 [Candidatus Acidiferrum sp.]
MVLTFAEFIELALGFVAFGVTVGGFVFGCVSVWNFFADLTADNNSE